LAAAISLSPAERSLRARIAAHTLHSRVDSSEHMKAAQAASPGQLAYWECKVDPNGELPEAERRRRAGESVAGSTGDCPCYAARTISILS
jgi:hypothetical protein